MNVPAMLSIIVGGTAGGFFLHGVDNLWWLQWDGDPRLTMSLMIVAAIADSFSPLIQM